MQSIELLSCAQRLQALAQAGLTFSENPYDLERYHEIRALSARLLQEVCEAPFEKIIRAFTADSGYQTPKVDIRSVVFNEAGHVLLVGEKLDGGRWTLPGGWADVGLSPFEVAAKEALEESGLVVEPLRLLALLDKRKHPHPPQPWCVYKAFILCRIVGGELIQDTPETAGARWFSPREVESLELSEDRATFSQLRMMFAFAADPTLPALCD